MSGPRPPKLLPEPFYIAQSRTQPPQQPRVKSLLSPREVKVTSQTCQHIFVLIIGDNKGYSQACTTLLHR